MLSRDKQTDRQTNQRYQKHNLLCQGGAREVKIEQSQALLSWWVKEEGWLQYNTTLNNIKRMLSPMGMGRGVQAAGKSWRKEDW